MERLASLARNASTAGTKEEGSRRAIENRTLPNMVSTVAHHPDLLAPFLEFAAVISRQGALLRRESELLALRAAWNCQSDFEWGHHVDYALEAGLSELEIARVPAGPSADGWSDSERALLEAADELHERHHVSDELWARLAARYSDKQLIEILFVVGQYTMLSMVVNSAGVELELGLKGLPTNPPPE